MDGVLCKQEKWLIFHGCATCGRVAVQCFLLQWFINNPFHWSTCKLVHTIHFVWPYLIQSAMYIWNWEREQQISYHSLLKSLSALRTKWKKILRCKMIGKLRVFLAIPFSFMFPFLLHMEKITINSNVSVYGNIQIFYGSDIHKWKPSRGKKTPFNHTQDTTQRIGIKTKLNNK